MRGCAAVKKHGTMQACSEFRGDNKNNKGFIFKQKPTHVNDPTVIISII